MRVHRGPAWPGACCQPTIRNSFAPFFCLVVIGVNGARAQTASVTGPPGGGTGVACVLTTTFVSQDLFRGTFLGGPSVEPSLDLSKGALDLGYWSNSTVSNRVEGPSSTELEIYGSYLIALVRDRVTVEPGFTLYALPWGPGFEGAHRASIEPSLSMTYSVGRAQLTPKLYDDLVLKVLTLELNAAYAVPVRAARTELDLTATVGAERSGAGLGEAQTSANPWSGYWLIGIAAPLQVGKAGTLTLGWCYTGIVQLEPRGFMFGGGTRSSRGLLTLGLSVRM
jgi:Bacterial protein of unknown function (Gcw_chp)